MGKASETDKGNFKRSANTMIALSAVIITKNEEDNIERCLQSLDWVDEIVVVDSGSTDRTAEICRERGCRLIESAWLGFGKTKQLAVLQATHDWVLSIDADEQVTDALRDQIIKNLSESPSVTGYRIQRRSYYLGKLIRFSGWNKDYPLRLFNKQFGNFNDHQVHEYVDLQGNTSVIDSHLLHYPYKSIALHVQKLNRYAQLGAAEAYKKGQRSTPLHAILSAKFKFIKMYLLKAGILDGYAGLVLAVNSAYGVYLKYIQLWQKEK
ncbi:MAG: glycosyltransferase [Caldithrix sp.]|nr:glycosyltransferase [Caldithrix sp.]